MPASDDTSSTPLFEEQFNIRLDADFIRTMIEFDPSLEHVTLEDFFYTLESLQLQGEEDESSKKRGTKQKFVSENRLTLQKTLIEFLRSEEKWQMLYLP